MSDARLNRQMLAELRAVMEDEFNLLLETFFADTEQRLEAIQAGLDEGKAEDFSRACHSLKGSASNLGWSSYGFCVSKGRFGASGFSGRCRCDRDPNQTGSERAGTLAPRRNGRILAINSTFFGAGLVPPGPEPKA